jgi:hypothetical protein
MSFIATASWCTRVEGLAVHPFRPVCGAITCKLTNSIEDTRRGHPPALFVAILLWQLYIHSRESFKIKVRTKQTYRISSSPPIPHRRGSTRVLPSSKHKKTTQYQISYLPILHCKRFQTQDNNSFRSHCSSNISDQRLARTSWAAVSNLMVVLRVSNSREVSIGFLSQSVRHSDDLQRCEFLNRDRSSVNLIKWEKC